MKIQTMSIANLEWSDVFCMFCGNHVWSEEGEGLKPCSHLLFLASNEGGVHYLSDSVAGILPPSDEEIDSDEYYFSERMNKLFDEEDNFPEDSFVITSDGDGPVPSTSWISFSP